MPLMKSKQEQMSYVNPLKKTECIITVWSKNSLNADIERGGMIDGNGIQVVKFPDDGHPTMCAEAVNLYGDARDEIVTWDYDSMYIYTQDDAPKDDVYSPFKYPDYNASNYRGEYSYREKWW